MSEPTYKGVPLSRLHIEDVLWTEERAEHIRTRSTRTGSAAAFDVEPEWATEAALDPERIVRVAAVDDPTTQSLKIVGWSPSAGRLLKVWVWSDAPATSGRWNGGSAALANESDAKRYTAMRQGGERDDEQRT